ncbi:DUF3592 domain-containing protein [Nocardioides sambongensis]|uniref:DUF3592 domain-containing protein n=1 Tax=Nocardioides sambongensis TaxID=2589074 RepID=UPI0015E85313|nr:DUF3592 domain-containing protein [Nocardioides sambongensis]
MARYTLLVLGVLLVWLSHTWGGPSESVEDFDRLRADGERSAGKVVEIREREVTHRRRRGRTWTETVHCPVVAYRARVDGVATRQRFVEYDACDGWAVGDEVTVLWDPAAPYEAHLDDDTVRDALAGDERSFRLGQWLGYGLVVVTVPVILLGWWRRIQRSRSSAPTGG